MRTEMKIPVRAYEVSIRDERTGEITSDTIVLEKSRIQAAQMVGVDDEYLIYKAYNRQGYRVLEIGKPQKVEISVDLTEMYRVRAELIAQMERDARDTE